MEVHRQRCQACNGLDMRNILVRQAGHPQVVYVRCLQCDTLVARYALREYYHHGKGFESWLHSYDGNPAESGRGMQGQFEATKKAAEEGYEAALKALEEDGKYI